MEGEAVVAEPGVGGLEPCRAGLPVPTGFSNVYLRRSV